jgi:hypothetical protein
MSNYLQFNQIWNVAQAATQRKVIMIQICFSFREEAGNLVDK